MSYFRTVAAVALLVLLVEAGEVTENGYPIQWEKAPSDLSELPTADGVTVINPWDFRHRMAMYRVLLKETDQYMGSMGPGPKESPLWVFPMQLGWKLKTGRLADPTGASTCGHAEDPICISTKSWWSCVNYHVSALPFLAAVHTGIIGDGQIQVQIQAPADGSQEYCTTFSDCSTKMPELMNKWETFFKSLKTISSSDIPDFEKKDQILGLMWAADLESIDVAFKSCSEKLKSYSGQEVSFAQSWRESTQYAAATHFQPSLEKIKVLMTPLPSRILQEGDNAPNIPDLSSEENHTLYVFSWMKRMNSLLGGSIMHVWRNAMCSARTREKGQVLMQELFLDPKFALSTVFSIITEMSSSC
ncbi:protein LEG1 homolog [Chanos chanos]|uniref:Protein LEG1 homolog n=1 Tax=Chanos chanos TaxID=29144 RepID=A0A6J2W1V3_CHACN|nr:protein LEG1 homolog [Chanos chanos]